MRISRKYLKKAVIVIIMGMLCLVFSSPYTGIYALEVEDSDSEVLEAYMQEDNIVVKVTPESGNGSANRVNGNGVENLIKNTQIWGDYGRGWFIIKDYGNGDQNGNEFIWDLKALAIEMKESYWDSSNQDGSDLFKIYVKYNSSRIVELYKTFYLGSTKEAVELTTGADKNSSYKPISYDFPVVVTQKQKVELYLNTAFGNQEPYQVVITGDRYSWQTKNIKKLLNQKVFEWVPEESGTFYITVKDSNHQTVLKRKVYVNSINDQYLQLEDLSINDINNISNTVCISLKVGNARPTGFNGSIDTNLKVVVSEPNEWYRTIKEYGNSVAYNEAKKVYEINEGPGRFTFGSGNYNVSAFIKTPSSIEPDDAIVKAYRKTDVDDVPFDVTYSVDPANALNNDGNYYLNKSPTFTFTINNPQEGYDYAFFLQDAKGKRNVQNYSKSVNFSWKPASSGEYNVYARIRLSKQLGTLQNSFEKEVSIPIRIVENPDKPSKLKEVRLNGNKWNINNGNVLKVISKAIKSHTLNVIEVESEVKGSDNKSRPMYKVYVVGKGYKYQLAPYSFNKYISFYPKSAGSYRLIVMAKDPKSGSQEDIWEELKINVVE